MSAMDVLAHDALLPASFFMAGFECATHRRRDGVRVDALASSGHGSNAAGDYRLAMAQGLATVRDGLRWHRIAQADQYDWSSWLPMLRAAEDAGVEVIWDLWHYGTPDTVDIWSSDFIVELTRFARAAASIHLQVTQRPAAWCPLNEMSFFSYIAGEVGDFHPYGQGRGYELKRHLAAAAISVAQALRSVDPRCRLVWAEPLIQVRPRSQDPTEIDRAHGFHAAQFQALDMVCGRLEPDLGGHRDLLDVVGCNFYPQNQWLMDGPTIPLGHHMHRPLSELLLEVHLRYERPMIIAETGAEGSGRAAWLHYVGQEVRAALALGIGLEGVCLYPVTDYAGWDDERPCPVGLFGPVKADGARDVHIPLRDELCRQQALLRHTLAVAPATSHGGRHLCSPSLDRI